MLTMQLVSQDFPTRPELYRGCQVVHFKRNELPASVLDKRPDCFLYQVMGIGIHTETNEKLVVYVSKETGDIFCRPIAQFIDEFDHEKYPSNKQKYRFQLYNAD